LFAFSNATCTALLNGLEIFDTFCSRYFVAFTVTYIIVKTTHYVIFPDLFP
jgi:hypothetical protein